MTDRICFEWLKKRYKDDEIVYRKNKFVRFITSDGKKFVPRKVYGNVVWFYKDQLNKLKEQENCYILLVTNDSVKEVSIQQIECGAVVDGVMIKCVSKNETTRTIEISKHIYDKLTILKGSKTWDELLEEMIRVYEINKFDIDYTGLKGEVLAAVGILTLYKQKRVRELQLLEKLIEPKRIDELEPEERGLIEKLLRWKLVIIEGSGDSIICQTVVFGELRMNPNHQELKVYYTPEFCRKYCSLWNECPMKDKGGVRVWKLPLVDELEELIGRVVLDVCK